ncbi:hypothetical protein [Paenibacillus hexagrammi]|uniref:Phage protein n=1 Tax=Paenibacillus hexagrammi TaxID=2908839 RepID=A0ABY3STZ8_9BACL|nr:hypothetical protein [Paenibacillus sp. YPD9-1]UJF36550.1 hypothetical protein L0M14_30650 [Paenibacillus sp. YPD9-1]
MTFTEWRIQEGYMSRAELIDKMIPLGHTMDDVEAIIDELRDEYFEYCEENEIEEEAE